MKVLSLVLAISLGTSALTRSAHAAKMINPLSEKEQRIFHQMQIRMLSLDKADLERISELRNHKGEPADFTSGNQPNLWATLDPKEDRKQGTSTEKLYQDVNIPVDEKKDVVVAIIDSGVDWTHPDLRGLMWENKAETGGEPGVDDDHNGYVDDFYGWNFVGHPGIPEGPARNLNMTTLESTREVIRLRALKEEGELSAEDSQALARAEKTYNAQKAQQEDNITYCLAVFESEKLLKANGLTEWTLAGVDQVPDINREIEDAKTLVKIAIGKKQKPQGLLDKALGMSRSVSHYFDLKDTTWMEINDDPTRTDDIGYGNNDVIGPDATHGTHVAGIIAANRFNNEGIMGQAQNVKFMILRAVPDGDERDKDVANAINYAAKMGAKIINMSFGKPLSPNKAYVDEAVRNALAQGVLFVHAAGNDSTNNDQFDNHYPNPIALNGEVFDHWIEVGASSQNNDEIHEDHPELNKTGLLAASFSNYGSASVDLFAPGVSIVSSVPGAKYAALNGTSMATPEVAGVAAILRSQFPNRSPVEIKKAIMDSVTRYPGVMVSLPGTTGKPDLPEKKVLFSTLSRTGGIVNASRAYETLQTWDEESNR